MTEINIIGSTPVVVGPSQPVTTNVVNGSPTNLGLVNIFNSFNIPNALSNSNNFAPILVLGVDDDIPNGTSPGTVILRLPD